MIQTFSLAMCQHLSSLAPEFEGHYGYYKFYDDSVSVACHEEIWWVEKHREFTQVRRKKPDLICPAWQVEDVQMNILSLTRMINNGKTQIYNGGIILNQIKEIILFSFPNTAYQKIEEYLWTILK